jgi:predicted naringenin-chalcone synthase
MGIDPDKIQLSRDVLCNYGNMSSATVLFILDALLKQGASSPCVMLGFGPGLVAEAALLL